MHIEEICLLVGEKYLLKNVVANKKLFINGTKNNSYDKINLYEFSQNYINMTEYELGIFLRLITLYFYKHTSKNMNINNFIERLSSIKLKKYISLLRKKGYFVKPIKYSVITIKTSEKYLRQKSSKVDFKDKELSNYIEILEDYCQKKQVFAISAIQLGIPKRIIYIKNTNKELVERMKNKENQTKKYAELRVLINPKIIKEKGLTEYWETCASCLNTMGHVYRPYEIEMEYYDLYNQKHRQVYKGFEATIIAHEYDHLDGILHIDKADKTLIMNAKKRKEFRKTHRYNIISK